MSKQTMKASDFEGLLENRKELRFSLLQTPFQALQTIEVISGDEGLASAYFFTLDKATRLEPAQALAVLLNVELHFYEMWELSETTESNIDLIIDNWLLKNPGNLKLLDIPSDIALAEITDITNAIVRHLALRDGSRPGRGGIYIDSVRTDNFPIHLLSSSGPSALGNLSLWNEKEIFYETSTRYVLFNWSTSA